MTISKDRACAEKSVSPNRRLGISKQNQRRTSLSHCASIGFVFAIFLFIAGCGSKSSITVQIQPSTTPSIDEGQSYNFTATVANDVTNSGVTWSLTQQGCSGTGCGALTNVTPFSVTYTAPTNLSAEESVTLTATANAHNVTTGTATISVQLPPMFTVPPTTSTTTGTTTAGTQLICAGPCQLAGGGNGQPYNQTITAADGVAPLIFTLASGSLPPGLNLNTSGTIVGTPSSPTVGQNPATFTFTVKLSDSAIPPESATQQFSIIIQPPTKLAITTTGPLPTALINGQYSTSVSASGGVTPITWSIVSGSGTLPPGLVLNPNSGQITGVPTLQSGVTYPKAYAFTVQAADSSLPSPGQVATVPLSITVQQPPPLTISTNALPGAFTATAYGASLQATGGIAPYTWTLVSGQLPAGLTFASNGTISGLPVMVTSTPAQFTVKVTDSEVTPASVTQTLNILVTAGTNSGDSLFQGQYGFLFQGFDNNGPVSIAGTIVADGNGNITAGVEDSNRVSGVVLAASITGTYSIGTDGRGKLELIATNPLTNVQLRTDYRLALYSNLNARFVEDNTINTNPGGDTVGTHGEGTLKLVTGTNASSGSTSGFANASFSGNYAFEFIGQDLSGKPAALAGSVVAQGDTATLTTGGELNSDFNDNGTVTSQSITGTFSIQGTFNRGSVKMTFEIPGKSALTLQFTCYFVSPTDLYFVEIDSPITTNTSVYDLLSGEMIGQQASYQFGIGSLAGSSVVTGTGVNGKNTSVLLGLLSSPTGNGVAALNYDENNGGTTATPSLTGTYAVGSNGRVSFNWAGTTTPRVGVAYLTGPGQGFLLGSDAAVTTGMLEQQTQITFSSASLEGSYALGTAAPQDTANTNVIGQLFASGGTPDTLIATDTIDEIAPPTTSNPGGVSNSAQSLSITIPTVNANGGGTMAANFTSFFPTNLVFYIVSPSSFRAISVDSNPGNGQPEVLLFDH